MEAGLEGPVPMLVLTLNVSVKFRTPVLNFFW